MHSNSLIAMVIKILHLMNLPQIYKNFINNLLKQISSKDFFD